MASPREEETVEKTEETGISMVDVLEEEEQLEQDANAVLGGSDHANCTYALASIIKCIIFTAPVILSHTRQI